MKILNLMKDFLEWIEAEKGYAYSTVEAYEYDILLFLKWYRDYGEERRESIDDIKLKEIKISHLREFIIYLAQEKNYSNTTRCRKIACLKSFWHYLSKTRKLSDNIASDLSMPKKEPTVEMYLKKDEIDKLFTAIRRLSRNMIRDQAILALLLYTEIRVSECVALNLNDISLENKTLRVVNGKGGKSRMIGINRELGPYLENYLSQRQKIAGQAFFLSERKSRISKRTLQYHFKRWVKEAGLSDEITIHKCRHTFLSHLCQNGASLAEIKQISGHKNLTSLQRYLHNDQKQLNEIVNKVSYIN